MKRRNLYIALLAGFLLTSTSCDDLVEVEPRNSIAPELAYSDIRSAQAVLIGSYNRIQAFTYWGRDMALMGDVLSDNIVTNATQAGNRYVGQNRNSAGSHFNFWNTGHFIVNEMNNFLANIDKVPTSTDAEAILKAHIKAEALSVRAMAFFDLARVYGYEPTNIVNGFDRSAVLDLDPTLTADQATMQGRASVGEVYAQIEKDLLAAIATFPKFPTNPNGQFANFRFNIGAANALLGKVYLYWGKNQEAVTKFEAARANTTATLATKYTDAVWGDVETILGVHFDQATEMSGVTGQNDSPFSYTQPTGFNDEALTTYGGQTVSPELRAAFNIAGAVDPGDQRDDLFFTRRTATSGTTSYVWADKYTSSHGSYTDYIKIIRYADVLLMQAEALANLGKTADAALLVTQLRTARGASVAAGVVPTDATILDFIKNERRRELYFEGHRWFDLKRWGQGITKPSSTGVGIIAANSRLILAPIPNTEIQLNPKLPQNPGY